MCEALNGLPGVTAEVLATDADGSDRFDTSRWSSSRTKLFLVPHGDRGQLYKWLEANVPRFDLLHTHSAWNGVVHAARRAAVRHRKPFIYRPCGMLSNYSWSRQKLLRYGVHLGRSGHLLVCLVIYHGSQPWREFHGTDARWQGLPAEARAALVALQARLDFLLIDLTAMPEADFRNPAYTPLAQLTLLCLRFLRHYAR